MSLLVPSRHVAGLEQHSAATVAAVPRRDRRMTESDRIIVD